jgi:hypothetical protein
LFFKLGAWLRITHLLYVDRFRFYHTTSHYLCHKMCYHSCLVEISLGLSRQFEDL